MFLLSFGSINAYIPLIIIIIFIAAAAGMTRGFSVFSLFGVSTLIGIGVGRGAGKGKSIYSQSKGSKSNVFKKTIPPPISVTRKAGKGKKVGGVYVSFPLYEGTKNFIENIPAMQRRRVKMAVKQLRKNSSQVQGSDQPSQVFMMSKAYKELESDVNSTDLGGQLINVKNEVDKRLKTLLNSPNLSEADREKIIDEIEQLMNTYYKVRNEYYKNDPSTLTGLVRNLARVNWRKAPSYFKGKKNVAGIILGGSPIYEKMGKFAKRMKKK
ncbi:MAG: hypothetical protein QXL16_03055 [Candidatus Micrarchaeaceae archaeon]